MHTYVKFLALFYTYMCVYVDTSNTYSFIYTLTFNLSVAFSVHLMAKFMAVLVI